LNCVKADSNIGYDDRLPGYGGVASQRSSVEMKKSGAGLH